MPTGWFKAVFTIKDALL